MVTVAYVVNGLGTGGTERSLAELLPHLAARDVHAIVTYLFPRREGIEASITSAGYDVRRLRGSNVVTRARALRAMLREERVALLHTMLFEASVTGRLATRSSSTPVVTSLVNTPYTDARFVDPNIRRLALRGVRLVDGWSARHWTDHFHAVSQTVRSAAISALRIPPERVTVIERGRDVVRLGSPSSDRRERARASLGLGADEQVVLSVGRHEYQKAHADLIDAVSKLLPSHPGLVVLIAGRTGASTPDLRSKIESAGLEARVRLLGHRDDVPELLSAADCFVLPSLYEGQPGALLEAMALAVPIVATDIPAVREVVAPDVDAVLVPARSPERLADAVARVLDDRHLAGALSAHGRETFFERFTVERSAERMAALYQQVLQTHREES